MHGEKEITIRSREGIIINKRIIKGQQKTMTFSYYHFDHGLKCHINVIGMGKRTSQTQSFNVGFK